MFGSLPEVVWPEEFSHVFAISIREERFQDLIQRLQFLPIPIRQVRGTLGHRIDRDWWVKNKYLAADSTMRRGEIGCFDSHRRVWEHVVQHHLPMAVILEDDVDLKAEHVPLLSQAFQELKQVDNHWDVLFLSRNQKSKRVQKIIGRQLAIPDKMSVGAFAYVVTYQAAQKLLRKCLPMKIALDHFLFFTMKDELRQYCIHPNPFHVLPVFSDTVFIY